MSDGVKKLVRRRITKVVVVDDVNDRGKETVSEERGGFESKSLEKEDKGGKDAARRRKLLGFAVRWRLLILLLQVRAWTMDVEDLEALFRLLGDDFEPQFSLLLCSSLLGGVENMQAALRVLDTSVDYRCEDGHFPFSASCLKNSNPNSHFSSETRVNPGIRG
jgi:hypothetical protein